MKLSDDLIQTAVRHALSSTPFIDIHTHLFAPRFGALALWGIDELLTYHYLEAELFRSSTITPDQYWPLPKLRRADLIWQTMFVEQAPLSESARGVVSVLSALGLPTDAPDLRQAREFFAAQNPELHRRRVFELAGVSEVVMTNDPLDPEEAPLWEDAGASHQQYRAALRLDRILNEWAGHWPVLAGEGYSVDAAASPEAISAVSRFLAKWVERMRPAYMAVSLPDTFQYPEETIRANLLRGAVLPACRDFQIPLALMIGVRRQVNPELRTAGDGVGRADLRSLERLCAEFPENRFLVTVLSRENQHELCVCARKFRNLMPFGCWWFLNQPSIIGEITRERLEMLGTSFIPQHSDARVLEQLIYKWRTTRAVLAPILTDTYRLLAQSGRPVTAEMIHEGVTQLFRSNFESCTGFSARS